MASQLDMGNYQATTQEIDFSFIVGNTVQAYKNRFPDRKFEAKIQEDIMMRGESVLLQLLLNNLLDNGIKYAPKEGIIEIQLTQLDGTIQLKVLDEGVGVPATDREKIFEKFYRVGAEYTRATKGTGLGLYLCKRIADFHNAKIAVTSNSPKGSIFIFTYLV